MGGGFRRPHPAPPAGGKTPTPPSPGRHRAASPGRWAGCGAGGPLAPRAAAGTSPKRTTGGPQTGGRPHPAAGPLGGPPPGEVGLGAGGARTQARPPTPRPGGRSQRPGHRPTAERPGGGGLRPPAPRRPATRPAAYLIWPSPTPPGAGGPPPRGRPRPQGAPAPETAAGPRGPGAAAYGAGAIPPGRGAASAAKKMPGDLPPGWTRLDEKKCGEDALSPPLAVTADTRFPPVRRSSPKRTRCRPVPYALAVRLSLGLRSCVP